MPASVPPARTLTDSLKASPLPGERIFREKVSGNSAKNRPQLAKAIRSLGPGDTLVLAEWDRATRSMNDGLAIINRVARAGALIRVLDRDYLDLTTPLGKGLLAFLSAIAEDERQRIISRAAQGREAARRRGVAFGPKPKLTEAQSTDIRARLANRESCRSVAASFKVHHSTIARLKAD